MSFSSGWLMLRSASSRRPAPLTARMWSRSATKAVRAKLLLSTSVYWAATVLISPMGEYFLKITSPSPVVKISSGSPRRMRWVRRISLGMTTRPSSSDCVNQVQKIFVKLQKALKYKDFQLLGAFTLVLLIESF